MSQIIWLTQSYACHDFYGGKKLIWGQHLTHPVLEIRIKFAGKVPVIALKAIPKTKFQKAQQIPLFIGVR
jgi:hypothetical protein